jgi:putative ATP-binding cassette transporter
MQLITLLLRYSRTLFFLVVITGIISGISNTAIIALINTSLTQAGPSPGTMARAFIALCLLLPLSRFASQALLARLAQGTIFQLRMKLCRQVLAAPLRQMEEIGIPRLLATLTDDIRAISDALISIPILCIMLAVVIGCLSYLAWLSPMVLLLVLGFMGVVIATYQLLVMKGTRFFRLARADQDALFNHLRSLTEGAKELKLHRGRLKEFFSESLRPTAESFQRHNVSGLTMYAIANSWGQVLLLALIGMLMFVLFEINYIDIHTLTGYILVLLSLLTPLDVILNVGPQLARANVALKNAQSLGLSLTAGSAEGEVDARRKDEAP